MFCFDSLAKARQNMPAIAHKAFHTEASQNLLSQQITAFNELVGRPSPEETAPELSQSPELDELLFEALSERLESERARIMGLPKSRRPLQQAVSNYQTERLESALTPA